MTLINIKMKLIRSGLGEKNPKRTLCNPSRGEEQIQSNSNASLYVNSARLFVKHNAQQNYAAQ